MELQFLMLIMIIGCLYVEGLDLSFEKSVKIDRFLSCPGHGNLPVAFQNMRFTPINRKFYVSGKIVAKRNITKQIKLVLKIERCRSKDSWDSCEPYNDLQIKNICDMAMSTFQPWTPFVSSLKPPLTCPLTKGTYVCQNGTFDANALTFFPFNGWFWKVHAEVYEIIAAPKLVMCTYVEGQIVSV